MSTNGRNMNLSLRARVEKTVLWDMNEHITTDFLEKIQL